MGSKRVYSLVYGRINGTLIVVTPVNASKLRHCCRQDDESCRYLKQTPGNESSGKQHANISKHAKASKPSAAALKQAAALLPLTANAGRCVWLSWARMRAVALLSESIAAQIEPAGRSAAPGNTERYVDTDLLHRRQPAADAACCRAPAGESTAAQTKPARAGVRCRVSAEPHLTANAGRCEWLSWARMRTAWSALAVKSGKCS